MFGPYVFNDCSERRTEARTTVGCVNDQQELHWGIRNSYLCLPYCKRGSCQGREHVPIPRNSNGNDVAM